MKALFAAILASALVVTEVKCHSATLNDLATATTTQDGDVDQREKQADLIRQDAGSDFAATQVSPLSMVEEERKNDVSGELRKHKDAVS